MSLSKQLYILISLIFLLIFAGNFFISVKNTKEYLEIESVTKAQDTATSLGMTLKAFMKNKKDPEIESIIKAIANRGFYKEIRLEDVGFTFTDLQLVEASKDIDGLHWKVTDVSIDAKYGELSSSDDEEQLANELSALENDKDELFNTTEEIKDDVYAFIPNENVKENDLLEIKFAATKDDKLANTTATLTYSKILVQDTRDVKFEYVPQWFIDSLPMDLPETSSEISDGWKSSAVIYVSANPGDAYAKLYEQAKGAIVYAIIAFVIAMLFLIIFLQLILKPLKNIERLAQNISQGQFEIIKELPWTTELKNVSLAMNDMSGKIEGVINKLNANLEGMTKKLSIDDLTGLSIKQTFETDMKKMFISKSKGYVFSVKIDNLGEYAKDKGNQAVDQFLKEFANILKECDTDILSYRFYGSEFAMIAKDVTYEQTVTLTKKIQEQLDVLAQKLDKTSIAHIGATPFNPYGTTPGMLASANEAYETAKQVGPNEVYIRDDSDLAKDMQEWKDLVFDIIDNVKFHVGFINDAHEFSSKNQLVMQEAFTQGKDNEGNDIPIGTFISIAEKYDKILDFDKAVVQKVIGHIKAKDIKYDISINLSLDSIANLEFKHWLAHEVKANENIASQLVFSITSYGVAKDIEQFKEFNKLVHQLGSKTIIKRFETKFMPLSSIKEFNLDYIRLARDYTTGINKDSTKYGFVESMQDLATLVNIKVFAENVKDDEDLNVVKKLGLYGASR